MLSRLSVTNALRKVQPLKIIIRSSSTNVPEVPPQKEVEEFPIPKLSDLPPHPDESERDFVNFPRIVDLPAVPPYRWGFMPETFFKFFYNKTGVTGPYVFTATVGTFLYSKEVIVYDPELLFTYVLAGVIGYCIHKYGYLTIEAEKAFIASSTSYVNSLRDAPLHFYNWKIDEEKAMQKYMSYKIIANEAKQENVHLQLESVYRDRLAEVGAAVKSKLDCALALQRTQNRVEQDHMVNWIVRNVKSSITPAQEAATLKKCIADLAAMKA